MLEGKGPAPLRFRSKLTLFSCDNQRDIRLARLRDGVPVTSDSARELSLRVQADSAARLMRMQFDLTDVQLGSEPGAASRMSFSRPFRVPLAGRLAAIEARTPQSYLHGATKSSDLAKLRRKLTALRNGIEAEIHGRASFAVSCLILVIVGCALGMIFKTGNFLNAFGLSVIPALICIALIVTGQHVSENDNSTLNLGLGLIWSGNVAVLALAVALLAHLHRR
jgi:lipopolysaccharide export LptBFGC system permease protein LptF